MIRQGRRGDRLPYGGGPSTSRCDKPFGLELMAERLKALRHSKGTITRSQAFNPRLLRIANSLTHQLVK